MRTVLLASIALCAAVLAHAQQPAKKKDDRPVIVVTGCVDGAWLDVRTTDPGGSYATRYKLRGSKQLLSEMRKELAGHLVEVTGAVTDVGSTVHRGKVVEIGKKTRIVTGAKDVPQQPTGAGDPELEVSSFRDLKDRCR